MALLSWTPLPSTAFSLSNKHTCLVPHDGQNDFAAVSQKSNLCIPRVPDAKYMD